MTDSLQVDEAGCRKLCVRIAAYWQRLGYRVSVAPALKTVETMDWRGAKNRFVYWTIVSDLGMHMPPRLA